MRLLILFLMSTWVGVSFGQVQPQFVMPIWFEDSLGNKDTVWVGGDPGASYQNLNPQFGEVAIPAPFDSVFEVRAVHGSDTEWETSKIIIEGSDAPGQCYLPAHTRIMIQAKYPPVKISWDTTMLATNYPCNLNTILTPDQYVFLLQNWYEARIIHCMMTRDSIEVDDLFPIPPPDQLEHPFEVEGQGVKVLPGLWFTGFWDYPHCFTTLPAHEPNIQSQINLAPNPVQRDLQIINQSSIEIKGVSIVSLTGQEMAYYFVNCLTCKVPMNKLAPGIYFIQMNLSNGNVITKKVIKN